MHEITMPRNELIELLEDDTSELIDTDRWKFGTYRTYKVEVGGKPYITTVTCHYENGLMDGEDTAYLSPAKLLTKTVTEWVEDKS